MGKKFLLLTVSVFLLTFINASYVSANTSLDEPVLGLELSNSGSEGYDGVPPIQDGEGTIPGPSRTPAPENCVMPACDASDSSKYFQNGEVRTISFRGEAQWSPENYLLTEEEYERATGTTGGLDRGAPSGLPRGGEGYSGECMSVVTSIAWTNYRVYYAPKGVVYTVTKKEKYSSSTRSWAETDWTIDYYGEWNQCNWPYVIVSVSICPLTTTNPTVTGPIGVGLPVQTGENPGDTDPASITRTQTIKQTLTTNMGRAWGGPSTLNKNQFNNLPGTRKIQYAKECKDDNIFSGLISGDGYVNHPGKWTMQGTIMQTTCYYIIFEGNEKFDKCTDPTSETAVDKAYMNCDGHLKDYDGKENTIDYSCPKPVVECVQGRDPECSGGPITDEALICLWEDPDVITPERKTYDVMNKTLTLYSDGESWTVDWKPMTFDLGGALDYTYTYEDYTYITTTKTEWIEEDYKSYPGWEVWRQVEGSVSCTYHPDPADYTTCSYGYNKTTTKEERNPNPPDDSGGWVDNGKQWEKRDPTPEGYLDDGTHWVPPGVTNKWTEYYISPHSSPGDPSLPASHFTQPFNGTYNKIKALMWAENPNDRANGIPGPEWGETLNISWYGAGERQQQFSVYQERHFTWTKTIKMQSWDGTYRTMKQIIPQHCTAKTVPFLIVSSRNSPR